MVGNRVNFIFNEPVGSLFGHFERRASNRSDRRKALCKVVWDDGTYDLVQQNEARRFTGEHLKDIDYGQCTIITSVDTTHTFNSFVFAAHAQGENTYLFVTSTVLATVYL